MTLSFPFLAAAAPTWLWIASALLAGLSIGGWRAKRFWGRRSAQKDTETAAVFVPECEGEDLPLRLRDLGDDFFARIVTETTRDGLVVQRLNGIVLWANDSYCTMMGRPRDQIVGRNPLEFCNPPHLRPSDEYIANFKYNTNHFAENQLELCHNQRGDGTTFWNQIGITFRTAPDGRRLAVLVCRDVTDQVERQNEVEEARANLEFLAAHDSLTALPNRATLIGFADHAIAAARLGGSGFGIIRIDLDRFKQINDTHGHAAGDAVLSEVAHRMATAIRAGDMAARVGGDEFVVACPGVSTLPDLRHICEELSSALNGPVAVGNHKVLVGASIGAALLAGECLTPDDLLNRSDFALYAVKKAGRGAVALYDQPMHEKFVQEKQIGEALIAALAQGALEYRYHPVVSLHLRRTIGLETVVRWTDPVLGEVPPAVFLPIATRLGLTPDIDLGAVQAALDAGVRLKAAGHDSIAVGFNASPELMARGDFLPRLVAMTEAAGLAPGDIVVEVVEGAVLDRRGDDSNILDALTKAGFLVFLDNFGHGHAGLSSLMHHDFHGVKIDRDMIRDLVTKANSRTVVETLVSLCVALDRHVVIEGVDSEDQLALLAGWGAVVVQGTLFTGALPLDEMLVWLETCDGPHNSDVIARFGHERAPEEAPEAGHVAIGDLGPRPPLPDLRSTG